ncbi:hypothetical protein D3C79_1034380 [compost metagenome]
MSMWVMTVSRCMQLRCFGSCMAMTCLAWPCLNRLRARCSTPWGVVRSDMPMSTAPRPMTSTSPPSMVELS